MPEWNESDRDQYEQVKETAQQRGHTEEGAEELAAVQVNKKKSQQEKAEKSEGEAD